MMKRIACLLLVSASACAADCDEKGLKRAVDALAALDHRMIGRLTAQSLFEGCKGLPASISKALQASGKAGPEERPTIFAFALAQTPDFGKAACPDFEKTFGSVASTGPGDKAKVLFNGCDYGKLGLMTEAEYTAATADWAGTLLAPSMFKWMLDHKVDKGLARQVCRNLAGYSK